MHSSSDTTSFLWLVRTQLKILHYLAEICVVSYNVTLIRCTNFNFPSDAELVHWKERHKYLSHENIVKSSTKIL